MCTASSDSTCVCLTGMENESECQLCSCRPMWCLMCLGRWFASRQDQQRPETWLSARVPCPTCRAKFCILDICAVRWQNQNTNPTRHFAPKNNLEAYFMTYWAINQSERSKQCAQPGSGLAVFLLYLLLTMFLTIYKAFGSAQFHLFTVPLRCIHPLGCNVLLMLLLLNHGQYKWVF